MGRLVEEHSRSVSRKTRRTNYPHDEFILDAVYTHNERVVHDIDVRQKLAVVEQCASQNPLGVLAEIERRQVGGLSVND